MALVLPNPTVPTNGQPLDATPILQNELAIAQAIQAFDGSQIVAGSVATAALAANVNPNTLLAATTFPFVRTGCVWSAVSGLAGTMSGGTIYYNGIPVAVNSIASNTFAVSSDTYVDVDKNGNVTYQAVSNNSASPSLTANSVRVAIVVTGASAISFVNLGQTDISISGFAPIVSSNALSVTDTLGNLIYPTDPNSKLLGYRPIIAALTGLSVTTSDLDLVGLAVPYIAPGNRKIKATLYSADYSQSGGIGSSDTLIKIKEGSTLLQKQATTAPTANFPVAVSVVYVGLPSAGLHTYKASIASNASGPAWAVDADPTFPAFIMVELE